MNFSPHGRFLAALLICCGIAGTARADDNGGGDRGSSSMADDGDGDQDRAQQLYSHGTIHSLPEIVHHLAGAVSGEVVGIRLRDRGGRWIYSFTLVTGDGRRLYVEVDASTMEVVGRKPTP